MKRAFNLDKLLSRFFSPPEILRFRELQCSTGMLISGSTALKFFERVVYPDSDLDLYIEHRFSRQVADWPIIILVTSTLLYLSRTTRSRSKKHSAVILTIKPISPE